MERFENRKLDRKDHLHIEILAHVARVILFPIFLLVRLYFLVCDYDYSERFSRL